MMGHSNTNSILIETNVIVLNKKKSFVTFFQLQLPSLLVKNSKLMRTKDYGHKNDTKVVTFCHFLRVKNLNDLFLTIRSYGVVEKVSDVICHC